MTPLLTPLYTPTEFVAYGMISTGAPMPAGTWEMSAQVPFRPMCLLFWAPPRCRVESFRIQNVEQLACAVNVQAFNGYHVTTPESFLRLFKPELTAPIEGRYSIVHQRFLPGAHPLLDASLSMKWIFPTLNLGAVASLRFSDPAQAFLLLGPALLDAPAPPAPSC